MPPDFTYFGKNHIKKREDKVKFNNYQDKIKMYAAGEIKDLFRQSGKIEMLIGIKKIIDNGGKNIRKQNNGTFF